MERRQFLTRLGSGLVLATLSAEAFAEELGRTPWMTEGPFYPYGRLPLDRDNDLIIVGKSTTPAIGAVTHLTGRILSASGEPIQNAVIEIWQVDGNGVYLAQGSTGYEDRNFQGYGRFETAADGAYRFRTVKPVPYPGRTPHIHVKVSVKGKPALTTQFFVKGEPSNARDGVYRSAGDARAQALVTRPFVPVSGSRIGELAANFDIVLGATPQENEFGNFGGPPPGGRGGRPPRRW
jgi:protocatechuate 3,4-dioxygenase, beta subunit